MSAGTVVDIEARRVEAKALPLSELLPRRRLVEVSGKHACARTTAAVSCVINDGGGVVCNRGAGLW